MFTPPGGENPAEASNQDVDKEPPKEDK